MYKPLVKLVALFTRKFPHQSIKIECFSTQMYIIAAAFIKQFYNTQRNVFMLLSYIITVRQAL